MRSRSRKLNRSRISLLDRLVEPRRKLIIATRDVATLTSPSFDAPNLEGHPAHLDQVGLPHRKPAPSFPLKLKRLKFLQPSPKQTAKLAPESAKSPSNRAYQRPFPLRFIDRLQQPVGIRPIALLILTWILMLVIIWGALQEIMNLGAPKLQKKQPITQVERRALIELLGALVIGGVGLSLLLTPVLKRAPRLEEDASVQNSVQD